MSANAAVPVIDTEQLLDAAESLTPLSVSAVRLTALLGASKVDMGDIVETVSFDQALTAAVLRQANSASSGNRVAVGTVRDAVVRLGTNTVVSVALASHLSTQMVRPVDEYGLRAGELWRQSVIASLAADLIRVISPAPVPADVVTSALLHDIGKLVLRRYRTGPVRDFVARAREMEGVEDHEAERAILGLHHGEMGALVAQHWFLPESVVAGVQYHHTPADHPEPACYAVFLADQIADHLTAAATPVDGRVIDLVGPVVLRHRAVATALEQLQIPAERLGQLVTQTASRFDRVRRLYFIEN